MLKFNIQHSESNHFLADSISCDTPIFYESTCNNIEAI